jgi:hypothetical protein
MLESNLVWNTENHKLLHEQIQKIIFLYILCLKDKQKTLLFKIPKFILYELIKKIDRKSFLEILNL